MSSTSKTANLELSQFTGTDKPAWLTDYNNDMYKIDMAVKSVKDGVEEKENEIEELRDKDLELASSIAANTTRIADIESKQTDDKTAIVVLKENYEQIHHEVVELTADVEELKEGHIYSTVEKVVGKWFDGRNIYEITKEFDNPTVETVEVIDTWILTLDDTNSYKIISYDGFYEISTNRVYSLLNTSQASKSDGGTVGSSVGAMTVENGKSYVYIQKNNDQLGWTVTKAVVAFRYIK